MKKSTRIMSMILVVLTVIGLLPISLFAVGESDTGGSIQASEMPEAVKGKGGIGDKITYAKLISSGISASDIIFYSDFNDRTVGTADHVKASSDGKSGAYGNSTDTVLSVVNSDEVLKWTAVDGTDKALTYTNAATGQLYLDIINQNAASKDAALSKLEGDRGFVLSADFKRGDKLVGGNLFNVIERVSSSPNGSTLIRLESDGNLYVNSEMIGSLRTDIYTTVTVYVDPGKNAVGGKYWVYINGANVNEDGYDFPLGTRTGDKAGPFYLSAARIYQLSAGTSIGANALSVDNVQLYYVSDSFKADDYVGLDTAGDKFVTDGNAVYYYKDGALLGKGTYTVDGMQYTFDSKGRLVKKVDTTPLVDLYGALDTISNSGDEVVNQINAGTLLARNTNVLRDAYTYEWARNIFGSSLGLSTLVTYWGDYDAIEFSVYTDEIKDLVVYFKASNATSKWSDGKESYMGSYINFSDRSIQGYKTNTTEGTKTLTNPLGIDGWSNIILDLDTFGVSRGSSFEKYDDFTSIYFATSGWDLDYAYAKNSSTLIINYQRNTINFAGINLVKYEVVKSLDEYMTSIGGELFPISGQVGFKTVGKVSVYYDPQTQSLVRSTTKWVEEEQKAYTFDENGKASLANGFYVQGGQSYYAVNGEVKTKDFELSGKKYRVNGNGSIAGVYGETYADWTPYASYEAWAHDSKTSYLLSDDFTACKGKIYDNRGGGGTYSVSKTVDGVGKFTFATNLKYSGGRGVTTTDGNTYLEFGNYFDSADQFVQIDLPSVTTTTVFDFDVKLGDNWNAEASFFQPISNATGGGSRVFGTALRINAQGYVYADGAASRLLFKLDSESFTRISLVVDPTNRVYTVYANGVKVFEKEEYAGSGSKNIGNLRMFQFTTRRDASSVCMDNLYIYSGTAPQKTVEATLRNGTVTENGATRIYENGAILTGEIDGKYYHPANGMLLSAENMNGRFYFGKLFENGKAVSTTGFNKVDGKWYYVSKNDGTVYAGNTYVIDGSYYVFGADGAIRFVVSAKETDFIGIKDFADNIAHFEIENDVDGAYLRFTENGTASVYYNFKTTQDLTTKRYLEMDIYVPTEYNYTDVLLNYGRLARYYGVKKVFDDKGAYTWQSDGTFKTEGDMDAYLKAKNYTRSNGDELTYNITYGKGITIDKSTDDSKKYIQEVKDSDGKVVEYWVYQRWAYNYMTPNSDKGIRLNNLTPGWNTIRVELPKENLGSAYECLKNVDFFNINFSGWSLNMTQSWNTAGTKDKVYSDLGKCDVRFSALRAGSFGACVDYDTYVSAGWSADNTYYLDNLGVRATGAKEIDGVWYDFAADGTCKGKLTGSVTLDHYTVGEDGKYVLGTQSKMIVDGVMLTSEGGQETTIPVGDKIYIVDANDNLITDKLVDYNDKFYYLDETGEGAPANGFITSGEGEEAKEKYYDEGELANGEYTVTDEDGTQDYYFNNGEGMGAFVVKDDGMVVYGSDGKYTEKTERPVLMTLKITKPESDTEVIKFWQFYGKGFKYVTEDIDGYTVKITIDGEAADEIDIESVTKETEIVVTYEANAADSEAD